MEWKNYKLSEIGEIVGGATPSTKISEYYDGDIPWISPKDLSNFEGKYISCGSKNITELGFNSCSCKILPKGSVLFSSRAPIGYIAIAKNSLCTNQGFKSVIPNRSIIDSEFLYYTLVFNKEYIKNQGSGTTFMEVSGKTMGNIEVSIPVNLSDQRKIAGILSALDAKIENNNKINANLEAQAQALFKSWFVDFTPFKDQPFVDSELGPIPQGWKVGKINEFVDVIYGAPYKSKLFNTQKEGLPLIRIRDLKTCSPQFYTKELLPNTELVNYGDVVAGMDAEFTPHIWLGETGLLNQRVCKFKPHTGISPLYSMLMIKPKLEFAQNYKVGTTVSHLGKSDIDKFIVIVPPLDIVKEVSSIFDAVLNEQINLAKENQRLAALRDTLLPKLMSGEIKL